MSKANRKEHAAPSVHRSPQTEYFFFVHGRLPQSPSVPAPSRREPLGGYRQIILYWSNQYFLQLFYQCIDLPTSEDVASCEKQTLILLFVTNLTLASLREGGGERSEPEGARGTLVHHS